MLYAAWLSNGNWEKRNGMLCSSEQPLMGRNLNTKSSYCMKETMLAQNILKIKCPRLAKNAYAMQHLLHHSIIYTFIHYHIMNEDGWTYSCIFELIPTEQVTFFLLVTISPLNFSFCINFWSRGLILFPPPVHGGPKPAPEPTASLIYRIC
jgi:hypothetical protein